LVAPGFGAKAALFLALAARETSRREEEPVGRDTGGKGVRRAIEASDGLLLLVGIPKAELTPATALEGGGTPGRGVPGAAAAIGRGVPGAEGALPGW
jgi:hypothetical protein